MRCMSLTVTRLTPSDAEVSPTPALYYEVLWITSGEADVTIDFETYHGYSGSLFFRAPGRAAGWTNTRHLTAWSLAFSVDFLDGGPADHRLLRSLGYFHSIDRQPEVVVQGREAVALGSLLERLDTEARVEGFEAGVVQRSLLRIFLVTVHRHYPEFWAGVPVTAARRLVEEYCLLVAEQFLVHRQVADYAARLGVTPDHLSASFRKLLGFPPSLLIQNHLVLEAKRLLAHTSLTVVQIADRLGFADSAYFARFFRKAAGQSPSEFRALRGA